MVLYVKVCMNVYVSVKASNCFMHCAQNAGGQPQRNEIGFSSFDSFAILPGRSSLRSSG